MADAETWQPYEPYPQPSHPQRNKIVDYPVIPTFQHWRFPHELPPSWNDIRELTQILQDPPGSHCRLTQCDYSVENAHLIPAAEKGWFDENTMYDYTISTEMDQMQDPNNTVRLRSDIHRVFDSKCFAIVPIKRRLVAYCLNAKPGSQVERLFHGVELQRLNNPPELLFARFAYSVFENLRGFLDARVERHLCFWTGDTWTTETCDVERCQQFSRVTASQGKSRSVSRKKRSRRDVEGMGSSSEESAEEEEENGRGRKRHRSEDSTSSDGASDSS
ncbi:uncharacterized protein Z520_06893 [Fonsecaea multimorphosa CBS 102226]|uniref:HNH nuclease domain-containing protein n=1 Tax=Fonsecaea multimorphosa CBS 102226 TaxID=1442371 RepID=A0A0D2IK97_9EURO|nr:uncharacterized protein Z520_06893 [Fonsecaea multimorphosa CBS 102226]KIX97441.1 hypothetical protein Z520_06893 [Fonsecaea multimorphosa CBS 102226]OAL23407.1 hypothetical protein AYO22_06457 [Fonsecaea multimorphosa]